MIQLFRDPSYDFIGKRRWAYLASAPFILVSLASIVTKEGLRYGIDFAGGTLVQLRFDEPTSIERIRNVAAVGCDSAPPADNGSPIVTICC